MKIVFVHIQKFFESSSKFSTHNPSFHWALAIFCGILSALCWSMWLLIFISSCIFSLYHPLNKKKFFIRLVFFFLVFVSAYFFTKTKSIYPKEAIVEGQGYFQIDSVTEFKKAHTQGWIYKGVLKQFVPVRENQTIRNVACSIIVKKQWERPIANQDYIINGILKQGRNSHYLKIDGRDWQCVKNTYSLAELRFQLKNSFQNYLKMHIPSTRAAVFLTGISIGIFNDTQMMQEFGQLGLQHIMAISGFHFSLIASFLSVFLQRFFSPKKTASILLCCLTLYFIFIGKSPSIERAYIATALFLISQICEKKSKSINSLGIALIIILISDPYLVFNLGFQFSFLATAAILFLTKPFENILETVFRSRSLKCVTQMNLLDQHGYIILSLTRKCLALTFAVHFATVPLILFHFHKFPFLSLIYNLFFPFLVSFSLCLLLMALFLSFLPWISNFIHEINSYYTHTILALTETPPPLLSKTFYMESIDSVYIIGLYSCLVLAAIYLFKKENQQNFFL